MRRSLLIILFIIVNCSISPWAVARPSFAANFAIIPVDLRSNTQPVITTGPITGKISACEGTPSFSPYIEQFEVSGTNLTGSVAAIAPAGFEVSLNSINGYGSSITISGSGAIIYVRSAASDAPGVISGYVLLTSPGAGDVQVPVSGFVLAQATIEPISSQTVNNGTPTTAVNFSGTGQAFTWTNDSPGIGLAANGIGNIASFKAINIGITPVTATINITPAYTGYAYVVNSGSNDVSVISTATNTVINSFNVGTDPRCVTVSPDGRRTYVSNFSDGTVSVINANRVIGTIQVGSNPLGISVSPDGSYAYVANAGSGTVSVINTITSLVVATIKVGHYPIATLVSPDGTKLFVVNQNDNSISVINIADYSLLRLMYLVQKPESVRISPDGRKLYCTEVGITTELIVIDLKNYQVIGSKEIGPHPGGLVFSKDGDRIYLANPSDNDVLVLNPINFVVLYTINVGGNPKGISLSADGNFLYVSNDVDNGYVSVISTISKAIITTINVGPNPLSLGNFVTQGSGCAGLPISFTITVEPSPQITATGTLLPLNTIYGTPSTTTTFTVSGTNIPSGILVTPPHGFEVSTDNLNFSNTITVGTTGTIPPTLVYIRLAAKTGVGSYSGNIVLGDNSEVNVKEPMPNCIVNAAVLTVTANSVEKIYGATITDKTVSKEFTITGLQNDETAGNVTITYGTGSAATDAVGVYPNSVVPSAIRGGTFNINNYTPQYIDNEIIVDSAVLTITADNKTRPFGRQNPIFTVSYRGFLNGDGPEQLTTLPVLSTLATIMSVAGQYPIMVSGATSADYAFKYVPGILTIIPPPYPLGIPNAFTPNGDGINDTWLILNIDKYPNCNVQVFDRYGEKVYTSVGYALPWDGKYKNTYLPTGPYYYIIDLKNGTGVVSGSVMIIR